MAKKQSPIKRKKTTRRARTKDICFVVMPFGGWLDDYYQDIYSPAIKAAGLDPHRADDLFRPSTIVNDIWAYTKKARLILADLSGKNPNVFYELGLAHALAKPAILVAESMDDVPFDLRALRVLVYDKNAPNWGESLHEKVKSSIKEVLKSPAEAVLPAFLDTKDSGPKPTLTAHEKEMIEIRQQMDLLQREVRTNHIRGHRKIGDIGPEAARTLIKQYLSEGMPDGAILRRLQQLGPPQDWVLDEIRELRSKKRRRPRP